METIRIPRVSVLMKDMEIFSNLSKFSAVTGYIPTTPANPASMCDIFSLKQESRLSNFLRSLRNTVLRTSRGDYKIIGDEEYTHTLFSTEARPELMELKKTLVQLIKKHETALGVLGEARMQCWKSKAKIQKYELMVETQKSALEYNQTEKKIRTSALKDTELMLDKWMAIHEKDHISFESKLLTEIKYRQKIQKISTDIEIDVLSKLDHSIRILMDQNKQNISDRDIAKYSNLLYSETCRTYKFVIVENIPCLKEWIEKPKYETSLMNGADIEKRIKHTQQSLHASTKG